MNTANEIETSYVSSCQKCPYFTMTYNDILSQDKKKPITMPDTPKIPSSKHYCPQCGGKMDLVGPLYCIGHEKL